MKTADELRKDLEVSATLRGRELRFRTTWGLFSPRGIDEGSGLLLRHLDVADGGTTLDLGCGYGALGVTIAAETPTGRVCMVDKDFLAVEYAGKNAQLNNLDNCEALLSNGFSHLPPELRFDTVVANLPAKVGRELLFILLSDARARLNPDGQIVVVTVNGLRKFIKRNFLEVFGNYKKLKQGKSYTVARATRSEHSSTVAR